MKLKTFLRQTLFILVLCLDFQALSDETVVAAEDVSFKLELVSSLARTAPVERLKD